MGRKPFISELLEEYQQRAAEREELRRGLENERKALLEGYTYVRDEAMDALKARAKR